MADFAFIALFVAGAVFFLGALRLLIEAFGVSPLWGLVCLFFPPAIILFVYFHWEDTRGAFYLMVASAVVAAVVGAAVPPSPKPMIPAMPEKTDQVGRVIRLTKGSPSRPC